MTRPKVVLELTLGEAEDVAVLLSDEAMRYKDKGWLDLSNEIFRQVDRIRQAEDVRLADGSRPSVRVRGTVNEWMEADPPPPGTTTARSTPTTRRQAPMADQPPEGGRPSEVPGSMKSDGCTAGQSNEGETP